MNNHRSLTVPQPLVRINNWITITLIAVAWIIQQPLLILIPTLYFGLGAFIGKNPIILIGKSLLNSKNQYVMEDKDQLRFNSTLAFIMLAVAVIGYYIGMPGIYYGFTVMCLAANLGAAFGYCIGCFFRYQWKQYRYRRSIR
ncbi:DUF4395 domain-containing protein [Bacillus sp. AGMB 02131]|uniref:DUF4395 domain-containing protein n=1 Tax=Peribacillus faecalis TaxID=2772559 RepID=A0A927CYR7_9BACI|nr:DUF4395 domain-containing protein [Peribacillus faecalis]MBD3110146.1 DUF4395 domain-containing protein [Peribacillus faecalis]